MLIPVDSSRLPDLNFLSTSAKTDFNTKIQEQNDAGTPLWTVKVIAEGTFDDDILKITVPANEAPKFQRVAPVVFENLIANHWSNKKNGSTGVSYSADSVSDADTGELFNG